VKLTIASAVVALALAATPAQAVINSITLSGGSAFTNGGVGAIVAQPATFAATGNNLNGFNELQNVTIGLGSASPRGSLFDANGLNLTAQVNIVSALRVSSHFFYITPTTGNRTATGTISFNQNVIAVQRASSVWGNARSAQLHNGLSDFTTLADIPATEATDTITLINPKTISYSLTIGAGNTDAFRVLTAVPEASTWAMMLVGFGMVGFGMRRRSTAVAA